MKHNMRLNHDPFVLIEEGSKTIELRLNDEKRSKTFWYERESYTNGNGCLRNAFH